MNKMEMIYRRKRNIGIAVMSVLAVALIVLLTCLFAKRKDVPGTVSEPAESSAVSETSVEAGEESTVSEEISAESSSDTEESSEQAVSEEESREENSEERSEEPSEEPSEEKSEEISDTEIQGDPSFPTEYINSVIDSDYVAVYCLTDDKLLYGKNENAKAYPASMTKLVTSMLAEKYIPEDQVMVVGPEIKRIGPGSSQMYLYPGDEYDLENLLLGLLLHSGNDVAYVLAVTIGRNLLGDQNASIDDALDAFLAEANRFVKAIGCRNTHMACPDGYHDDDHYTTALDYTIIGAEVLKNYPLTRRICATEGSYIQTVYGYKIRNEYGNPQWYNNSNPLIDKTYVTGLKTGTTDEAGYCLALSTKNEGKEYIIILMHASSIYNRNLDAQYLVSAAHGWY